MSDESYFTFPLCFLFPSISLPGTYCCCVSLLGLLARLISPSEKADKQTGSLTENQIIIEDNK